MVNKLWKTLPNLSLSLKSSTNTLEQVEIYYSRPYPWQTHLFLRSLMPQIRSLLLNVELLHPRDRHREWHFIFNMADHRFMTFL